LAFAALLCAQPPNNSLGGTWELNLQESDFGALQKPNFAITRTITQQGAEIEISDKITHPQAAEDVSRSSGSNVAKPLVQPERIETEIIKLFTDGRHSTVTSTLASFSATATWKGSTLIVSMSGTRPNEGQFTQQESWNLSNAGNTLVVKQTTKSAKYSNIVTYIFKRI
jgi:hypothetical protein